MAHDHFQPDDRAEPGIGGSIIAEAQERLRDHRERADQEVFVRQQGLQHRNRRRALFATLVAATLITPAVIGVRWLGLPMGALLGIVIVVAHQRHVPIRWTWLAVALIALLSGLPFAVAEHHAGTSLLLILLGILGLGCLPLTLRWLSAPSKNQADPAPTGDIGLVGRFTPPKALLQRGDRQVVLADINHSLSESCYRSSLIRVVLLGMIAAWVLHPLHDAALSPAVSGTAVSGGLGSSSSPARAQSLMTLVGGLAAAGIAYWELSVPIGMLLYGLLVCGAQLLMIACGLSGFTVWTSMWVWLAWIVVGGGLTMLTEHRDLATPQRTT